MPKFEVKSPIQHDGELHQIGAVVELSDKAAKPLLAAGAVASVLVTSGAPTEPTDPAARLAQIKSAIEVLDTEEKKLWTKDGRPDLAALFELLGWRATGAERDQAWAEISKPKE